ncbi:MAG: hypothetical protein QM758_15435 [Armatimonas sp.]
MLTLSKRYDDPYGIPLQRTWKVADRELETSYQFERSSNPNELVLEHQHHQLYSENKWYTWTQGEASDGDVLQIQRHEIESRLLSGDSGLLDEASYLVDEPSTPNWYQAIWSSPWLMRMPDRFADGHRQWVLQQTYHKPDSLEYHRKVWGIDVQTRQISWAEHWAFSGNTPQKLLVRDDFSYNIPIPDSTFEVPDNLQKKTPDGEMPVWFTEPSLRIYVAPISWRSWWNNILVGR